MGSRKYTATRSEYARSGDTVTSVTGESWCWNGQSGSFPTCAKVTFAREYWYDGGRQRYLDRKLTPPTLWHEAALAGSSPLSETWTDYDGDEPYGDFTWSGPTWTPVRSFELGIGRVEPFVSSGNNNSSYYHTDMLGTTRMITGVNGVAVNSPVFTAFGEKLAGTLDGSPNRYGYVGAHGYQTHDDTPFLHLGARYYDPAMGRFLQRDPVGVSGGQNVYEYARNSPSSMVDPVGAKPITVNGAPMPDPGGPGTLGDKRSDYYKRRMHQLGWAGCSMVDFLDLRNIWKFIDHSGRVHREAMQFYPDPPPTPVREGTDYNPNQPRSQPPNYCNRCFKAG